MKDKFTRVKQFVQAHPKPFLYGSGVFVGAALMHLTHTHSDPFRDSDALIMLEVTEKHLEHVKEIGKAVTYDTPLGQFALFQVPLPEDL